jgi:hypothetical protein
MDRDLGGYSITPAGILICAHRVEWMEMDEENSVVPRLILGTCHGVVAIRCDRLPPLPRPRRAIE